MTTEEGNKIIAKFFCGGNPLCHFGNSHAEDNGMFFDEEKGESYVGASKWYNEKNLKFHSSWSWQVPAYSKLANEMKEIDIKTKYLPPINLQYTQLLLEYQVALLENSRQKGFEIIIENLKWLQDQKK